MRLYTALGPDVLRVKPVEGWKRGKAFVFYPELSAGSGIRTLLAWSWSHPLLLISLIGNGDRH
ncbi:MAG: hypothetical protein WCF14_04085 [Nitrososphaeraceae archaeon]